MIERGDIRYEAREWSAPTVPSAQISAHSSASNTETEGHIERKVQVCMFLEELGYDLPSTQVRINDKIVRQYSCLEESTGGLRADVYLESVDGNLVAEVGYVPANYLLRAFGFTSIAKPDDIEAIHNGGLFRKTETDVRTFVTSPYRASTHVHVFEAVDLPDPNPGRITDEVGKILNNENSE